MFHVTSELVETETISFIRLLKVFGIMYIYGQLSFLNVIFHVIFYSLAFGGFSSQVHEKFKMMINLQCY